MRWAIHGSPNTYVEFDDESVVVMDDDGVYYYVRLDRKNGSAV